ncbi:hypothetical protein O6H91_01G073100 [Diphasiastrum complanatum]|uniref:Uncharacterized protein n=1 Tax=Diphasiastrum complanatum TaxID=34168 RepID=A0ACC2ESC5_DIPCM|nr:hypothetical protein O6H91_01G073100 [Diphasiastrum complanatum]
MASSLCFLSHHRLLSPIASASSSSSSSSSSSAVRSRSRIALQAACVLRTPALSDPCLLLEPRNSFIHGARVASRFDGERGRRCHRLVAHSKRSYYDHVVSAQQQLSTPGASKNLEYEFKDEGSDLDLRLQLHHEDGALPLTAKDISVDAQESSLVVAARIPQGARTLLAASRLYGRIKPSETVWFVDETEVVFSLKKADKELVWPGLLEDWETLCLGVPKMLKGTSVYIVGHSTDINWAVAQKVANALGYTPIQTKQLLEELTKRSLVELEAVDGDEGVTEAEDAILATLNTHVRVTVATLGGAKGVAARTNTWNHLYGGITIWLAQSKAQDDIAAQEEAVKAKDEGITAYSKADVIVALGGWESDSAESASEGCLRALKYLLDADKELPGKKNLYIRLGCRGDWPDIMPPGWDPKSEKANLDDPVQVSVL